jgi:beta-glucosidase
VVANSPFEVECTVANAGDRDAVEVVQVYAHLMDRDGVAADEPDQRLVGFAKVSAPAGSSQRVHIALDPHGYRRWDVAIGTWGTPSFAYELRVGRSSIDVVARVEVRS